MAEDEGRDDATLAETLGAFGARPLLDGTPDPDASPSGPVLEPPLDEGKEPEESPLGRLLGWVRWAAAPLGFFLFLSALTAYGVLRDREGTSGSPAPPAVVTEPPPRLTAPVGEGSTAPTTAAGASATTLAEPPLQPEGSPPVPAETQPSRMTVTTTPARLGPVCGYTPGQSINISVNGRPAGRVTADARGCVSVHR